MFDLTGRVALVTGATGGIGEAIATALHAQGATLAVTGRREAELARVAEALGNQRVLVAPADLADPAAPAALVEKVEGALGSLDILVNNAGFTRDMLALRMGDADWNAVLEVDLTAPFRLARAALRGMMKKRHGRIVSIASIVEVACAGSRDARRDGERRRAGLREDRDDRRPERGAEDRPAVAHPDPAHGRAGGHRRRRRLPRQRRGRLGHWPDPARQRRHGDVLTTGRPAV
jgi:NAD(P)-dependent dehydrogenase (short-subunit alcohol dehydrogenase family)